MEELTTTAAGLEAVSVITKTTYLLFLFLILAIFVERSVEIFMSALKYADLKLGWLKHWNRKAKKFQTRYDRFLKNQGEHSRDKQLLFRWILWRFVSEEPYTGGRVIIAAKSIRTHYYRIYSRIFAFSIALLFSLVVYLKMDLDLVNILENVSGVQLLNGDQNMTLVKILLTTAILAGGSEPMHHLIKRAEKIGKTKKAPTS